MSYGRSASNASQQLHARPYVAYARCNVTVNRSQGLGFGASISDEEWSSASEKHAVLSGIEGNSSTDLPIHIVTCNSGWVDLDIVFGTSYTVTSL